MCQWNNIDKTCLDHAGMLEETHGTQIIIKHKMILREETAIVQ